MAGPHTLARKLDKVQRKTVTSKRQMPSVLLATPASPSLARQPALAGDFDRRRTDEVIEAARSAASSENRRGSSGALGTEDGIVASRATSV